MKPLNVLSLFDGAGIGLLALKRAGIPVAKYYASEIDKYAIQIAKKNHPEIIHIGDVKNVWARNLPKIDLLIGGSPCQDLSIAKSNREGLKGARSGLFWHYVRLLRTTNPKYFLLENVASMRKEDRDKITEILCFGPALLDSKYFSAQNRERLFWTNLPITKPEKESQLVLRDIMLSGVDEKYFYNYPLEDVDMSKQVCALMQYKNHDIHRRILNPNFKSNTLTCCGGGNTEKKVLDNGRARKLTPTEYERLQTWPDGYTEGVSNTQRYKMLGNGWTADLIAYIFSFIPKEEEQWKYI